MATLTLRPNAAGTYQQWSTFGSPPSHWAGTSDQNDATGVQVTGNTTYKETENLQDASQTGTINSVTAYMRAKATGSGAGEKAVILWRTYATDYESAAQTISRTAFTDYSEARTVNPNTGLAWTWTEVNALEVGSRASALGSGEVIQCSEFWIVVDYTPAAVDKSFSDVLGLADAFTMVITQQAKSFADSIGLTDVFSIPWKSMGFSDAIGLSDAFSKEVIGGPVTKDFTDSIGLSDAFDKVVTFQTKSFSDVIGLSDAFTVEVLGGVISKSFSDSIGLSDAFSGIKKRNYGGIIRIAPADYVPSATFSFEAVIKYGGGANQAYAYLWNITDGVEVSNSRISTTNTTFTRVRSNPLSLSAVKEYRAEIEVALGETMTCKLAKVIVKQVV